MPRPCLKIRTALAFTSLLIRTKKRNRCNLRKTDNCIMLSFCPTVFLPLLWKNLKDFAARLSSKARPTFIGGPGSLSARLPVRPILKANASMRPKNPQKGPEPGPAAHPSSHSVMATPTAIAAMSSTHAPTVGLFRASGQRLARAARTQ